MPSIWGHKHLFLAASALTRLPFTPSRCNLANNSHSTNLLVIRLYLANVDYRERGPSRRLAIRRAEEVVEVAGARSFAATQALRANPNPLTFACWRWAVCAELGAIAALTALRRGFGQFRG